MNFVYQKTERAELEECTKFTRQRIPSQLLHIYPQKEMFVELVVKEECDLEIRHLISQRPLTFSV